MSNNPYPSLPITDGASVIIYSPRTSADDLIRPLSPTSSLKGVYVRSRPTSMEIPAESLGFDFGGFYQPGFNPTIQESPSHSHSLSLSTLSDENEPIFSPTTSESSHLSSAATSVYTDEDYIQKSAARRTAETQARVQALSEGHARTRSYYAESIAPSVKTNASKNTLLTIAFGRRFNKKAERGVACKDIEEEDYSCTGITKDSPRAQKKRSIPLVYRAVTKKVYGVFHRKADSTPESIQVPPPSFSDKDTPAILMENPMFAEHVKSSSISLFTMKRRPTVDSQQGPPRSKKMFPQRAPSISGNKNTFPAATNILSITSTSLAIENQARLRRSISFSGFIDLPEIDGELDEATAEATQVATKASMVRWANARYRQGYDSDAVDDGYVFERNVE